MESIRAVIVDDEPLGMATLENLIQDHFPYIKIVGKAGSVADGLRVLLETDPDLVFLDIAMSDGTGFDLLQQLPEEPSFALIFTTAFAEYAVKAFDFSAMNYLLKPISLEDLQKTMGQYHKQQRRDRLESLQVLIDTMQDRFERIALPTQNGIEFVEVEDIVRCEASGSYTEFFLSDDRRIIVSRSLSNFEHLLPNTHFFRIHHKHLVNLQYIRRYVKGSGGSVILKNGDQLDVSVRRKEKFLQAVANFG